MKYSQWDEEAAILEFFRGNASGRFLDLGAFDGVTGSNTRALRVLGWGGVCVEAAPENFIALARLYGNDPRVDCLCAAVLWKPGIAEFHHAGGQCGTLREDHSVAVEHSYYVPAVTPAQIAAHFGEIFDFVSVDVEGIELELLPALGPVLAQASLLCLEDAIPCREFDQAYYDSLLRAAAAHGFDKVLARTAPPDGGSGNTLLTKSSGGFRA